MESIGYIAGFLTLVGYLPQTIKTIRTRHTKSISLATFVIIGTSALLWTIFGLSKGLPAIWITNAVVCGCSSIIIYIKLISDKV